MENSSPRWVIVCMLLQVGVLTGRSEDAFANINCPSPQYVVVGRTGRLDCSFPQRFNAVYWKYEQGDETFSLVGLEGGVKRGHGYENGTYDIHSDGSLIIEEVEVEDEGVYSVMLVTSDDNVKHFRITLETTDDFANINCPSPQYVVLGRTGRLDCSFPQRFTAVYWKYEYGHEKFSLVGLEGAVKRGRGYENGKYDIHSNGSLIIEEVGVEDEVVYMVMLVTLEDNVKHFRITVIVTVLSQQNQPYINLCGKDDHCFRRYDPDTPIYCSYNHSRPAVNLNWYIRYPSRDKLLQASFNYEPDSNKTFSSISRFNIEDITAGSVMLIVCVASGPPLTPYTVENWMILDTSLTIYKIPNDVSISKMDVPLYGNPVLPCGEIQPTLGAVFWSSVDLTSLTSTLVYSMYHTPQRRRYTYSTVSFDDTSTKISLFRVTRENEQVYVCRSINGTHTEVMAAYQLVVFVTPIPPYIEVDACSIDTIHCQLRSREGTLACCISRVYDNVELATYVRDKSKISTSNEQRSMTSIGDGFVDHCFTFDYKLHQDVCEYPVSVFCYARTHGGLEIVPKKEITFMNQEKCQSDILATFLVIAFSILGALVSVIAVLLIIIVRLCRLNLK